MIRKTDKRWMEELESLYDGPIGDNELIQLMRFTFWGKLQRYFREPGYLLDLGCGTGIDASFMCGIGHAVLGIDWSEEMLEKAAKKRDFFGFEDQMYLEKMAIQELSGLAETGEFDGIYSNLGALNTIGDLKQVSTQCYRLLKPGGFLIAAVSGKYCPWEYLWFRWKGDPDRAALRYREGKSAGSFGGKPIWIHYHAPRDFYHYFRDEFELWTYQSLHLFMPPPWLEHVYLRRKGIFAILSGLDELLSWVPVLRNAGDQFIMVLKKRDSV